MAVKANGTLLEWAGYEYGVDDGDPDGPMSCKTYESAKALARKVCGHVVMRAVYVTDWMETTDDPR